MKFSLDTLRFAVWRRSLLNCISAAFLVGLITHAAPARADPTPALNRCRNNQHADYAEYVTVWGRSGGSMPSGTNPPNILQTGDAYQVLPYYALSWEHDWVSIDLWGHRYGPDGNRVPASSGGRFPGLFEFSMVLRFNNNPGGWVGSPVQASAFAGCQTWLSSYPIRFLFYVNDTQDWDNGGYWRVLVNIWRAAL